jgi:hypothetical protein
MYKNSFGTQNQISFNNESEYYQALGYLAKSDGTTSIHWENNEEQGAWGSEGRIHFNIQNPNIPGTFRLTAGRPGVEHRTNCNEFIRHIVTHHNFIMGNTQNIQNIRDTIPEQYINDFEYGLTL